MLYLIAILILTIVFAAKADKPINKDGTSNYNNLNNYKDYDNDDEYDSNDEYDKNWQINSKIKWQNDNRKKFRALIYKGKQAYREGCSCQIEDIEQMESFFQFPIMFQCKNCLKIYMCTCFKDAYEMAYPVLRKSYELHEGKYNENFIFLYEEAEYKEGICHLCTGKTPLLHISKYSNTFNRRYAAYIEAEVIRASGYASEFGYQCRLEHNASKKLKKICRDAENKVREQFGFKKVGEPHIEETTLYNIVIELYPEYKVIREYSPEWLNRKRIDIFIKELSIGIEYQGKQHFEPIEHFGGNKAFEKNIKRDKEKKISCDKNGIKLVYFNYNEKLTAELVKNRIERQIPKIRYRF